MKQHHIVFISVILLCSWSIVDSYKILVLSLIPAVSHYNLGKGIADILHNRGHEITFISCYASEKPSYREIVVKEPHALKNDSMVNFDMNKKSNIMSIFMMTEWLTNIMDVALSNKDVHKFMNDKSEKYDLVVVSYFMNEALYGFSVKYNCPLIVISPVSIMNWLARATGNPTSPEIIPNMFLGLPSNMNLLQRTANVAVDFFQEIVGRTHLKPNQAQLYKKHFPKEAAKVDFYELNKNIALIFSNSHPSMGLARPLLPNVVEIGGFHIGDIKPLPEEYQNILDNAKHGVIFFSMGSNLKSAMLPENIKSDILKVFSGLKQTVLWKYESDLPGKPDNVIIKKWMPQSSILAHPNLKLFITHGGLNSATEAASIGVPLLSIPIFGDQKFNAKATQDKGLGVQIEFNNLTIESLTWGLSEVMNNTNYKEAALKTSKLYHDRPMRPKDLITFYVEHVIRTGGAKHLSAPNIGFISSLLLDVVAVLLLPPLILFMTAIYLCRKCTNKIPSKKSKKEKKN